MPAKKAHLTWSDVKTKLIDFDRAGLLALVQDLYASSKDNQVFLHARLNVGDDPLKPYKINITRWLWPNVFKNQHTSVNQAKKTISDYKKAIGQPDGLAELTIFYCEQASGFSNNIGLDDESYFNALVRMFEQALKVIANLPEAQRPDLWERLDSVRFASRDLGYGVGEDIDCLFSKYGLGD
jgi:hypothetical protein